MTSLRRAVGLFLTGALCGVTLFADVGSAQSGPTKSACQARVIDELSAVENDYRAHIFGSREDRDGNFTVLTGGKTDQAYHGVFDVQGRVTSELVSPLVESYRVLRCRSIAVCEAARQSLGTNVGQMLTIRPLGCTQQQIRSYQECNFADTEDQSATSDATDVEQSCGVLVGESLKAERAVLKLAVSYDSGYRAALQLAGMIDWMQEDLPSQALKPVRDMVNLLGKLHEIPCFIGECESPDTSAL